MKYINRIAVLVAALMFVVCAFGQVTTDVTKTGIASNYLGEYTYASLPSAANNNHRTALATDLGTNGTIVVSNGTRWRPINGQVTLKQLSATSSNVAGTETVVLQTLIPAGAWQPGDSIIAFFPETKSGTTDIGNIGLRIGTAGTTSDTAVLTLQGFLAAGSLSGGTWIEFSLGSGSTTVQRVGNASAAGSSWSGATSVSANPVTITSAASNSLYISETINSAGTTNTVALQAGARIVWQTP